MFGYLCAFPDFFLIIISQDVFLDIAVKLRLYRHLLNGCRLGRFVQHQFIKRNAEQVAHSDKLLHIRRRIADLPLRDSLTRDIQPVREFLLRKSLLFTQFVKFIIELHISCLPFCIILFIYLPQQYSCRSYDNISDNACFYAVVPAVEKIVSNTSHIDERG